jgi:hypothetical protein
VGATSSQVISRLSGERTTGYGFLNAAQAASIELIPFTTRITEDKRDRYLEQKLLAEKSGILNW